MPETRPVLTLAHSPDPDDVFMWWPITGKVTRAHGASPQLPTVSDPVIPTGRFSYRALPVDIAILNRRAVSHGDIDITALSLRAWLDVQDRYRLTHCGSSFGDGYGPKVVCKPALASHYTSAKTLAIPGRTTTAFMTLSLAEPQWIKNVAILEMPFDEVLTAVSTGKADAGLVIHEGQVTFAQAGLVMALDLGSWWKAETQLPLPLGVNAVKRDVDHRFGSGSMQEIATTLRASLDYALAHRDESLDYAMTFALASPDGQHITRERVDRYINMYVNRWTIDMGTAGTQAIQTLLNRAAAAGLCPVPQRVDPA
jgi:1,4-dihydroxy-6-naphthoate synthase